MSVTVGSVTFDCGDALVVGRFWSEVLGRPLDNAPMPPSRDFASIGRDEPSQNGFMFIRVPEGKSTKNRLHLDLESNDVAGDVARLTALGATPIHEKAEFGHTWTTLADPEGNEFCISPPHQ